MSNPNYKETTPLSDIVSLKLDDSGFRYEMVKWGTIIYEHDLNPFSRHTPSGDFLNKSLMDTYEGILTRIGPIHPLVVFDHEAGYTYLGPLELYYAYERVVKKLKTELYVYIAVLPIGTSPEKIIEVSTLLNPDENIPDQLYRLMRLKHLQDKGLTNAQIKKFLRVGKSNGAFATQVGRDAAICRIPIAYELTTGITHNDNPLQLPKPLDARISYTTALQLEEKFGDDESLWIKYKNELDLWIQQKKGYEQTTDISIPIYKRDWYKKERDKPLKLAYEILDQQYKGVKKTNISISDFKPWDISVTDSNVRILTIPSARIDLKKKSFENIKLLYDIVYKMELVSRSLRSYLGLIMPIEQGGEIKGHASMDDKTIELRSNLTEFDGFNYAQFILGTNGIKYSDCYRLLKSLNLTFKTFGFKNSNDTMSVKKIRSSFFKWDRENAYKMESKLKLFDDLGSVLSRQVIYKKLKECIMDLDINDEREVSFEDFYLLIFTRSFRAWQYEYDKGKRDAKLIQTGEKVKKYYQKMKRKNAKKKKVTKKTTKKIKKETRSGPRQNESKLTRKSSKKKQPILKKLSKKRSAKRK